MGKSWRGGGRGVPELSEIQGRAELAFGEASRFKNKQQERDNIIKLDAHSSQQKLWKLSSQGKQE